jgi:hypothetical protein
MLKNKFLWLAVATTALICLVFMGPLYQHPNEWVFSSTGDGLQTYYQSSWHVQNDTSAWHQSSMNYPFGESIFFTGGQPLISNIVRWISPVVDLSNYITGITNLTMLLSVLLCAMFIYLIFQHFKITPWIAVGGAVLLTLTTQQWDRMGGHYTLAWLFAVPGMLYFLFHFYDKPDYKRSLKIVLYMLFLGMAHLYYIVFFAVLAASFLIVHLLSDKERLRLRYMGNFMLQVAVPYLIIHLLVNYSSDVTDRTALPWGFMEFRSSIGSYLFPYGMWYESFFNGLKPNSNPSWEGIAYIGGAAWLLFSLLVIAFFLRIARWRKWVQQIPPTEWSLLVATIACFLISIAFPFNAGHEDWLKYAGPLQQFRGIGRFAFVAFVPLNILLFVRFNALQVFGGSFKRVFLLLVFLTGISEGIFRLQRQAVLISNERSDALRADASIPDVLREKAFQSILPLPFFHVGSENIWLPDEAGISNAVYDLSLGLKCPTFAALMSRTSISQTFKSIALTRELMEYPEILDAVQVQTPILLLADTNHLNHAEFKLLNHAKYLADFRNFRCYELQPQAFREILEDNKQIMRLPSPSNNDEIVASDSSAFVYYNALDTPIDVRENWQSIGRTKIDLSWRGKTVLISFWIDDFARDLIPRANVEIVQKVEDRVVGFDSEIPGKRLIGIFQGDALVEYPVRIHEDAAEIEVLIRNQLAKNQQFRPFSILIRPEEVNCSILHNEIRYYNNRRYH